MWLSRIPKMGLSPGIAAWLPAGITTVLAVISFYVSVLFLAPLITREGEISAQRINKPGHLFVITGRRTEF